jgi:hypothetical protein
MRQISCATRAFVRPPAALRCSHASPISGPSVVVSEASGGPSEDAAGSSGKRIRCPWGVRPEGGEPWEVRRHLMTEDSILHFIGSQN